MISPILPWAPGRRRSRKGCPPGGLTGRGLDTTLVAGMFFEVLMDAAQLPAGPRERVSFVRQKAKDYLVNRLAGQITLSQFYRLLNLIEEQVGYYFEHLTDDWTGALRSREVVPPGAAGHRRRRPAPGPGPPLPAFGGPA